MIRHSLASRRSCSAVTLAVLLRAQAVLFSLLLFTGCCVWPHALAMQHGESPFSLVDDTEAAGGEYPPAPASLPELLKWAPQMLDQLSKKRRGQMLLDTLAWL